MKYVQRRQTKESAGISPLCCPLTLSFPNNIPHCQGSKAYFLSFLNYACIIIHHFCIICKLYSFTSLFYSQISYQYTQFYARKSDPRRYRKTPEHVLYRKSGIIHPGCFRHMLRRISAFLFLFNSFCLFISGSDHFQLRYTLLLSAPADP